MRCRTREQDLLLLVHKELSPARSLLLWAHLRGCAACQQRHAGLTWASHAIAGVVRAETMPLWLPGHAPAARYASLSTRWWLVSGLILLIGTVTLLYPHVTASPIPRSAAVSYPCLPVPARTIPSTSPSSLPPSLSPKSCPFSHH